MPAGSTKRRTWNRVTAGLYAISSLFACFQVMAADAASRHPDGPNIAFYYQGNLPIDELQAFDVVVVDPARVDLPEVQRTPHTAWFARVDVRGLDMPSAGAPDVAVARALKPLWDKGYRGFLIEDGASIDDHEPRDATRLEGILRALRVAYPQARFMLRNHLPVARSNAEGLFAVVVDSLYRRDTGYGGLLAEVPEQIRESALQEIRQIQAETTLPVVAVDYCPGTDKACRRGTAERLKTDGVLPFVTAPGFGIVGTGRIEVMPRKVLLVQALGPAEPLDRSMGARTIAMPLNYLGYDIRYADINKGLPKDITSDRYAGIVVAIDGPIVDTGAWRQWLLARISEGLRVAVVNQFGFRIDARTAGALGLELVPGSAPLGGTPQVASQAPIMGFEYMPLADVRSAVGIRVGPTGRSLLRLQVGGYAYDPAGITQWGGYALAPYGMVALNALGQYRWAFQPLDFFRQALALEDIPVPDLTSENGRRLMFTQVNGDGFASRVEFARDRGRFSGEVLYDEVFTRYRVPMTVSVVEGETGPAGKYPELAPALESIGRRIFALPNVEIASHTYSHPFQWSRIDDVTGQRIDAGKSPGRPDDAFSMDIPGYAFDLDREIGGSIEYIDRRLAPPGKKTVALLWSGDAAAPRVALRRASQAGVLAINGGDTVITKTNNSWTNISPYGVAKGDHPAEYQVYAAAMNENVHAVDWLGAYAGFDRVLETFALTGEPIRFKALDIYYHFYSATKLAYLKALGTVFESALRQPVFPIFTTEYVTRALEWRQVAIARDGDRWLVRSGANLRQLRWPGQGVPDLSTASGIAGYLPGPGGLYIHMGGEQAAFRISPEGQASLPHVRQASGFIRNFQRQGRDMQFDFGGYYEPFVEIAEVSGCSVNVDGMPVGIRGSAGTRRLDVPGEAMKPVAYHAIKVKCEKE
jgi:hypothetical protein